MPDSFRLFFDFLPALRVQWKELRLRVGRRFLTEWQVPRKWALDASSPFEKVRVLDPEPAGSLLEEARENLSRTFPFFSNMVEAERWAGLIDVTPDAVPVISPVSTRGTRRRETSIAVAGPPRADRPRRDGPESKRGCSYRCL